MSGWEGSNRRAELGPEWHKTRQRVLTRDGGRCTFRLPRSGNRCPHPANQVDHIDNSALGRMNHDLSNLRSLCEHHHKQVTQGQAQGARAQKKKASQRREEQHPGLVVRRPQEEA